MVRPTRRHFLKAASVVAASTATGKKLWASVAPSDLGDHLAAQGRDYQLRYLRATDRLEVRDSAGRLIFAAPLQPVLVLADAQTGRPLPPPTVAKREQRLDADRIHFLYTLADGAGEIRISLRLTEGGFRLEPVEYRSASATDLVSLHSFAHPAPQPAPGLEAGFLVVPGISEGSSVSPIQSNEVGIHETVWLGRGSGAQGLNQQWGLPVHYFCGFSRHNPGAGTRESWTTGQSSAFTCGLADLPGGDLFLNMSGGNSSLLIDYRGDLWQHLRGPGTFTLGPSLWFTFADTYRESIRRYYLALKDERVVTVPPASDRKLATMLATQFCTWGAQVTRGKLGKLLDQEFLETIYTELAASGMKAELVSIDDKWEGIYGGLTHDAARLPHFEAFLDRIRADGRKVGLWTALMRCEDPATMGLTLDNMLRTPDGKPLREDGGYYILDFTQPQVAQVLRDLVIRFMQRYKPDLVKFDFGYELPTVRQAAPADKTFMGERLLSRGLQIVIPAMRSVNPDVVVMYYNLSPLYLDFFDLHGLDDMFQAYREFAVEANRRIFFASLLGELGVPVYGSSGYDWRSDPEIWFDSAASGTIGSLNDFTLDDAGEKPTPRTLALYNGVRRAIRHTRTSRIVAIAGPEPAPTLGAHAHTWARLEGEQLVLLARRPLPPWSDLPAQMTGEESALYATVDSEMPVIVASKTADAIPQSSSLVLVPFGEGPVAIRTRQQKPAHITLHYLGGAVTRQVTQPAAGWLRITPPGSLHSSPLESVEIAF